MASRRSSEPKRTGATQLTTTAPAHAVRGGISLLILPLGGFMVLPAAGGVLLWLGAASQGLQVFGVVLALVLWIVAYVINEQAEPRHRRERHRAVASIAWLGLVFGWVVALGPSKWWVAVELTGGLALGLWWFFVKTEAVRGNGSDSHGDGGAWAKAIGLPETTTPTAVKDEHGERHVTVRHSDATTDDVVKAKGKIEAKGGLPKGAVRVDPVTVKGRVMSHLSRLVISDTTYLDKIGEWPGPHNPGALVSDPVRAGWAIDRKPSEWVLTPTETYVGSSAGLSSGLAGAAKTAFMLNVLGTLVARQGVVLWASDTRKSGQWVPYLRPFIDWLAVTPEEAEAQLDAMAEIVPVRTQLITDLTGEDRWTPRCWTEFGIPFLLVWGAEAAPLMGPLEEHLIRGVEVWRSVGEKYVAEVHRPSEGNMSTDFRNLIGESVAFRQSKPEDGRMSLSEDTLDLGAEPWAIPGDMPGVHWAEFVNEPASRWGMKRRTERPNRQRVAEATAEWMTTHPEWHRLDPQTAAAAQKGSRGRYGKRERVDVATWHTTKWGQVPQLKTPGVMRWVEQARAAKPVPGVLEPEALPEPTAAPAPQPAPEPARPADPDVVDDQDDDTTPPDDEDEPMHNPAEDQEIAMESDRVLADVDADVVRELGHDPDEPVTPPTAQAVAELEQAHAAGQPGDDDPDVDFSFTPTPGERPSREQRAANFQALVRALFEDRDLAEAVQVEKLLDGTRWVTVSTELLTQMWLDFPGEDVRPALYDRLRAHTKARRGRPATARQLSRGRWAISEHALDAPLVLPDDYDPDADTTDDEDDATLRDLAGADA